MARFTRIQVAQTMAEQGMDPLFYHSDLKFAKRSFPPFIEVARDC